MDLFQVEEENREIIKGYKVDTPEVIYTFQKYYKLPNTYTLIKKEDS